MRTRPMTAMDPIPRARTSSLPVRACGRSRAGSSGRATRRPNSSLTSTRTTGRRSGPTPISSCPDSDWSSAHDRPSRPQPSSPRRAQGIRPATADDTRRTDRRRRRPHRRNGDVAGRRLSRDLRRSAEERVDRPLGRCGTAREDRPARAAACGDRPGLHGPRPRRRTHTAGGTGAGLPRHATVAEATVMVRTQSRFRAVAVRLELIANRWTMTALETM